jgi:hypothetical protein
MKLTKQNVKIIKTFIHHCLKELGIKKKVRIILSKNQTELPTAGYFNPHKREVFVAIHNRAIADVMRTISHELTHCKQADDGIIFPEDDAGLQQFEDSANLMAGRLVRFYGRKHREIYADLSPTYLQEFLFPNTKGRKIIGS